MNINKLKNTLTEEEIALARHCLAYAQEQGAQQVRITLSKTLMNLIGVLNGEVDKTAHALDRSLQLQIFVDGRFGTFSSNRLEEKELEEFIREAIQTVKMLEADSCRTLPAPERLAHDALTGRELDLYDDAYDSLTAERRRDLALQSCHYPHCSCHQAQASGETSWRLIAEEGEYSDSVFDSLTIDSQGLYARHSETTFEIGYESTVEDARGNHFSSYWWDASPRLKDLQLEGCAQKACQRAAEQIGPQSVPSGQYTLIIDSECASKLLTPVLNALGGHSLQQKNSFLVDSLGKALFPKNLSIVDAPRTPGESGCRLFDSEGVATREMPIIEKGVVKSYFLNTYISAKMGLEPTVEDATRVKVLPTGGCRTQEDVLRKVGNGILVTGFNGGNSNSSTGAFSYGIEGFYFKDGSIVHPVREMLITGHFIDLWNHLAAAGNDARPCTSRQIPTLAFTQTAFSA